MQYVSSFFEKKTFKMSALKQMNELKNLGTVNENELQPVTENFRKRAPKK